MLHCTRNTAFCNNNALHDRLLTLLTLYVSDFTDGAVEPRGILIRQLWVGLGTKRVILQPQIL